MFGIGSITKTFTAIAVIVMTLRRATLAAVKLVHTLAWFSIESCMVYVLWAGFRRRSDRRAAIAAGVVAGESLVFAANGFRCPLTQLAERVGAERGSVTDIYLPRSLARHLPAIHVPLILMATWLHARNLRHRAGMSGSPAGGATASRFNASCPTSLARLLRPRPWGTADGEGLSAS